MRIRIVPPAKTVFETLFTESERRARTISERSGTDPTDPTTMIREKLALHLAELDSARSVARDQDRNLVRQECYARTELIHMEQRTPRYSPYRFPEREKLQRRLVKIEDERRRLLHERHTERVDLMGRIRELCHQHAQLEQ